MGSGVAGAVTGQAHSRLKRSLHRVGVKHSVRRQDSANVSRLTDGKSACCTIPDDVASQVFDDFTFIRAFKPRQQVSLELLQGTQILTEDQGVVNVCTHEDVMLEDIILLAHPNAFFKVRSDESIVDHPAVEGVVEGACRVRDAVERS